jgi:SAM-dependent methyltransferase
MAPLVTPTLSDLRAALQRDPAVADAMFDRFLPPEYQSCSRVHWTPLVTAFWLGARLDAWGARCLLDLGSGAGKLCVAAALASRCSFVGVEQRPRMVAAARMLARRFQVAHRVRFIEGALGEVSLPACDTYYCFNPFGENLLDPEEWLDGTVELGMQRYARDTGLLEDLLEGLPLGTRFITYNRAGSRVPASYRQLRVERSLPSPLRVWEKARVESGGRWHVEREE